MKWDKQTLGEALSRAAREWPEQEALVIDGRRMTYAALAQAAQRVAAGLHALGIRRGDHVAVCMGNSLEWVSLFYGAATLGAVTVPVNTRFKAEELKYCLSQADIRLLFVSDRFLKIDFIAMLREIVPAIDRALPDAALPRLAHAVVLGQEIPRGALRHADFLAQGAGSDHAVRPDDVLLIQYTSGTTSYPKGAMLTHDNMLRNAAYVSERFDLHRGDRYYSARVFYHVAGTTLSLLAALAAGATLCSTSHFDPEQALRVMSGERCTHTSGNDTMFLMLVSHPEIRRYPLSLRGGWASAGPEVSRLAVEKMGMRGLCHAYGLSETSPNVFMSWWNDDLEKRINGWGHVLEGIETRVVDPETGGDRPPREPGEILVRGWSVMKGYYNMPEHTAKAMDRDGWFHSGDLGVSDGEGRMRFLTRIKDVFRVGGENVAPAEIEDVLQRHPGIRQAQVVGVPDARLGEVPVAYVTLKAGESASPEQIIAWSRERMANFRVPRHVKIVDSFENIGMTGSAKIQKNRLRAQALIDFGLENMEA